MISLGISAEDDEADELAYNEFDSPSSKRGETKVTNL
jgi:hypothetical protein